MYPLGMVQHALRLGLLATLAVLALSACGGGQEQADRPRPLPEDEKALRPGEYRSQEFKPSLSFRVGKGWSTSPPESSDVLFLTRGETATLGFGNIREAYDPSKTGSPNTVSAPTDMVAWFRRHPYLRTSTPEPVTVGGVKGIRFDVVGVDIPEGYWGDCGTDCVDIARFRDGQTLFHPKGIKARVIVLKEVEGKTVTMGFSNQSSEFEEFAPKAQKVVDSVQWTSA